MNQIVYAPADAQGGEQVPLEVYPVRRVYTFHPADFHRALANKIANKGHLRSGALHQLAVDVVASASAVTQEALGYMCFDPEWLDVSESDAPRTEWYIVALAQELAAIPAPDVNRSGAYSAMGRLLPLAGWTQSEAELLLRGADLQTLLESSGNELFMRAFGGVDQFGTWLSEPDIDRLLRHLAKGAGQFLAPPAEWQNALRDKMEEVRATHRRRPDLHPELTQWWTQGSLPEIISKAYLEITFLLETARQRESALLMMIR